MENMTMMTDLYELTMAQVYFNAGKKEEEAIFDVFFRKNPLELGYAIMGGVDRIIEYVENLKFTKEDIEYLDSTKLFSKEFLEYLKQFKFTGDIYAIPDGTPVFKGEPLVTIKAPIIQAQIIETAILSYMNANICYTTATKKITEITKEIGIMEFGARRAFGPEAAVEASKCAIIGGAIGTSNVLAGKKYNIPILGTMAHSMITEAKSEKEAFLNFAKTYPENCVLLVDTYDVLKSGVPNAIEVAKEYLIPNGYSLKGIRIDSGDLAYLSKEAKRMLEEAGLGDTKICLSDGLNAQKLQDLKKQGAIIDSIGLGDNIVAPDKGRVGCVYKNVAIVEDGNVIPKIKVSSDKEKTINPGYKKVYRIYEKETNKAIEDIIILENENIEEILNKYNNNYVYKILQKQIFSKGMKIYNDMNLYEKRTYCTKEMETIPEDIKCFPEYKNYSVKLSEELTDLKQEMINKYVTKDASLSVTSI